MRPDASGERPRVADGAATLDVRRGHDIPVDANGVVQPRSGGMSVVADAPSNLPGHRLPPELGGTGKGHAVFRIFQPSLPRCLVARQDNPRFHPEHRCIEPTQECLFEDFRVDIINTCDLWERI